MADQHFPDCCYCGNVFDSTAHRPLLLHCGHVLCKQCLSSQEDEDRQACTDPGCLQDWSDHQLNDLQTVFNLMPPESHSASGTVADESMEVTGREVLPAPSNNSGGRTGREVMPVTGAQGRSAAPFPTCTVCLSHFNGKDQKPIILPCSHVFCRWCLEGLRDMNDRNCPCCRKSWSHKSLDDMPVVKNMIHPDNHDTFLHGKKKPSPKGPTGNKLNSRQLTENVAKMRFRAASRVPQEEADPKMELYVRGVNGQNATIWARKSDRVATLYKELKAHWGPGVESQRMVFGGRNLEKTLTLNSYNICANSSLHMTCRMVGG